MSAHRFFLTAPLPEGDGPLLAPLSAGDVHHAVNVLRIKPGESVELVEPGDGGTWAAEVATAELAGVTVVRAVRLVRSDYLRVTLVQGVAKGDKMDTIVRQAVEVGAAAVMPVLTERSVVKLDANKRGDRGERWRRIAKSAAEQAHRDCIPRVTDPVPLTETLAELRTYDLVIVLWEDEHSRHLLSAVDPSIMRAGASIALVVGPEGGLSAEEVASLEEVGAVPCALGESILRTETAAVVALALVLHAGVPADTSAGARGE